MRVVEFFKVRGMPIYLAIRESNAYWSFEFKYSTDQNDEDYYKTLGREILTIKDYSNLIKMVFTLLKEDIYPEYNLRYGSTSVCLNEDVTKFFLFV